MYWENNENCKEETYLLVKLQLLSQSNAHVSWTVMINGTLYDIDIMAADDELIRKSGKLRGRKIFIGESNCHVKTLISWLMMI